MRREIGDLRAVCWCVVVVFVRSARHDAVQLLTRSARDRRAAYAVELTADNRVRC